MTIKISSRYRPVIFAFLMSLNTALIVSGVITFINTPSLELFYKKWPSSFLLGWPIVFICILVIAPNLNKLINLFVDQ